MITEIIHHNMPTLRQPNKCKQCGRGGVICPSVKYSEAGKECVISAYFERPSMRGIARAFEISRPTLINWLKKNSQLPEIEQTLLPKETEGKLELDEVWSFVLKKINKRWLWTALCRRTRQIVTYAIGDKSESTCHQLWARLPKDYRECHTYIDFWDAYAQVFPEEMHRSIGKESGETNHMERWNNTLRQWLGRYTRDTLSFSKSDFYHDLVTRLFIIRYNLNKALAF